MFYFVIFFDDLEYFSYSIVMSIEICDTECVWNEAFIIAENSGVGKSHFVRKYGSEMNRVRFLVIVKNATIVEEEFCRRSGNRCIVQTKLYEIYFKPDGVSLEKSGLYPLAEDRPIVELWTLRDHNEATKLIKICQSNMEEFKANLPTILHPQQHTRKASKSL